MTAEANYAAGFSVAAPCADDIEIAKEVISVSTTLFDSISGDFDPPSGSIWDLHVRHRQRDFLRALAEQDPGAVAEQLVDLPKSELGHGFFQGQAKYKNVQYRHTLRIAEFSENVALLSRLEPLDPPPVLNGAFGIISARGHFHRRHLAAAYAASKIAEHRPSHVCEIGGGIGATAFFAHKQGISRYTLVDLPVICLIQYWYLRRALPSANIKLAASPIAAEISIVPTWVFPQLSGYDLVFNMDSFPEMGDEVCRQYLRKIDQAATLLSINHEMAWPLEERPDGPRQSIVAGLAREAGFRRLSRHASPALPGYFEEAYVKA